MIKPLTSLSREHQQQTTCAVEPFYLWRQRPFERGPERHSSEMNRGDDLSVHFLRLLTETYRYQPSFNVAPKTYQVSGFIVLPFSSKTIQPVMMTEDGERVLRCMRWGEWYLYILIFSDHIFSLEIRSRSIVRQVGRVWFKDDQCEMWDSKGKWSVEKTHREEEMCCHG